MTPCPACAEHLETIRALGETCDRLVAALTKIANGEAPMPVAEGWRADGEPSRHDMCPHGQRMYEGCGSCIEDFASAAITEMQRGGGARLHPPAEAGE